MKVIKNRLIIIIICAVFALMVFLIFIKFRGNGAQTDDSDSPGDSRYDIEDLSPSVWESGDGTVAVADSGDFGVEQTLSEESLLDYYNDRSVASSVSAPGYLNDSVLQCGLINGGTLSVGCIDSSVRDMLVLNPFYEISGASDDNKYGIFVKADWSSVSYAEADTYDVAHADRNSAVTGRTYDTLVPSDSGVFWTCADRLVTDLSIPDAITLFFRVVRFSDYMVMGTAQCSILYKNGHFYLAELHSSDVRDTCILSDDERSAMVNDVIDFIFNPDSGPSFSTVFTDDRDVMYNFAAVENCGAPYFSSLLSPSGDYIAAGSLSNCNLIAVNIPYPGTGNITVYLAPLLQAEGFHVESVFFGDNSGYTIIGYDYLYPFSRDTLLIPDSAADSFSANRSIY